MRLGVKIQTTKIDDNTKIGMRLGSTFLTDNKTTVELQLQERINNTFSFNEQKKITRLKSALTRAINVLEGDATARQCYAAYEAFERAWI